MPSFHQVVLAVVLTSLGLAVDGVIHQRSQWIWIGSIVALLVGAYWALAGLVALWVQLFSRRA